MDSREPAARQTPPGTGTTGRGRRRAAWSAATFVLGLLAAEGLVRALDLGPPPLPVVKGGLLRDVDDPHLQFENLPGGVQQITYRDRPGGPPRVVLAHVNALGMRGELVERAKPEGALRIACLGDSHTFGYGVSDGESWPDVLLATLRREFAKRPIEVLNFGVNAFDTEQEVAQLERRVLDYQPDVVLIGFYLNDTALRKLGSEAAVEPGFWVRAFDRRQTGWFAWLRAHSRLADLTADACYRRIANAYYARSRSAGYAPDHAGWIRVQAALQRARDLTAARGAELGVVLIPFLFRQGRELGSTAAFEIVQGFCAAEGISCLDAEPAFDGLDVDALRLHPQDYHATPAAHRILGETVARWVTERRWVEH